MLDDLDLSEFAQWLIEEANHLAKDEERTGALILFKLLLKHNLGASDAINVCHRWFAGEYEALAPARLMSLLLQYQPNQTEVILTKLFDALERRDTEAGNLIRSEVNLAGTDALIPAFRASSKRLERERVGRAKPVENLFEGAIARQIVQSPDCILTCVEFIQSQNLHFGISRYWWQALSAAVKQGSQGARQHFEFDLPRMEDEDYALWGYVQLLFLASGPKTDKSTKIWAIQILQDLQDENPSLYAEATGIKEQITSGGGSVSVKTRKRTGNTEIT